MDIRPAREKRQRIPKNGSDLAAMKNSAAVRNASTTPTAAGIFHYSREFQHTVPRGSGPRGNKGRVAAERAKDLPHWQLARANTDKGCWHANGAYIFAGGQEEFAGCRFGVALTAVEMGPVFQRKAFPSLSCLTEP